MLQEEQEEQGRKVEWPPNLGSQEHLSGEAVPQEGADINNISDDQQIHLDPDQNLTTKYPSGLKIRDEAPLRQMPLQIHPSQPAFKITQPMKMRGDSKWPPKAGVEEEPQVVVREFIRPKKQTKDYSGFFAQHALPSNYTSYRPPPGTQHIGLEEGDDEGGAEGGMGVTNM